MKYRNSFYSFYLQKYQENDEMFDFFTDVYHHFFLLDVDEEEYDEEPCVKWDHIDAQAIGNTVTYIGLGIYNFDREMVMEKKQYIKDAVYLNNNRDTLFKCSNIVFRNRLKKVCGHSVFTIIPGFNGLMRQSHTEQLILLPGKENRF